MTAPSRTGAQRRRRRAVATRAGLFAAMAVGAGTTGLWWADARADPASSAALWNAIGLGVGGLAGGVWMASLLTSRRRATPALAPGRTPVDALTGRDRLAPAPRTSHPRRPGGHGRRPHGAGLRAAVPARRHPHPRPGAAGRRARGARDAGPRLVVPGLESRGGPGRRPRRITATPSRWTELWQGFVQAVERRGRDDGLIERDVASAAVLIVASTGLLVLVSGVVGTAHGYPGWLAAVAGRRAGGRGGHGVRPAIARRRRPGRPLGGLRRRAVGPDRPHPARPGLRRGARGGPGRDRARLAEHDRDWPAQLIHDEVERHVTGWREAYLAATSVRGEPSERIRAFLSLRALRRGPSPSLARS